MSKLRENRFTLYNEIFNKNPHDNIPFSDYCAQRGIHKPSNLVNNRKIIPAETSTAKDSMIVFSFS